MDSEQMNKAATYRSTLINRLLRLYLEGAMLPENDGPLSVPVIQRLMRHIVNEGYGAEDDQ